MAFRIGFENRLAVALRVANNRSFARMALFAADYPGGSVVKATGVCSGVAAFGELRIKPCRS